MALPRSASGRPCWAQYPGRSQAPYGSPRWLPRVGPAPRRCGLVVGHVVGAPLQPKVTLSGRRALIRVDEPNLALLDVPQIAAPFEHATLDEGNDAGGQEPLPSLKVRLLHWVPNTPRKVKKLKLPRRQSIFPS